MDTESSQLPAFASWAIVEIMGRKQFAGMVSEQVIAGKGFLRVDVPETKHAKAFTKYFGTSSIYALTPTDEETARRFAEALREQPFETWRIQLPGSSGYGEPDDPEVELRQDRYRELTEGDEEEGEDDVGSGYDPDFVDEPDVSQGEVG